MSIGTDLKAAREARKITLEKISERTKIPVKYLEAIERDEFSVFPSQTYVTGFIRAYGKVVGLDLQALTRQFKAEVKPQEMRISPMNVEAEMEKTMGWKAPSLRRPSVLQPPNEETLAEPLAEDLDEGFRREPTSLMRQRTSAFRRGRFLKKLGQGALLVLALAGLVAGIHYASRIISNWKWTSSPKPSSPSSVAGASAELAPVADKYQHLILKGLDKSWVLVTIDDGKSSTQVDLDQGETKTYKALKNFKVRLGNAGGVEVQYNGRPLGVLGTTGQVVEIQLPPGADGLRTPMDDTNS